MKMLTDAELRLKFREAATEMSNQEISELIETDNFKLMKADAEPGTVHWHYTEAVEAELMVRRYPAASYGYPKWEQRQRSETDILEAISKMPMAISLHHWYAALTPECKEVVVRMFDRLPTRAQKIFSRVEHERSLYAYEQAMKVID